MQRQRDKPAPRAKPENQRAGDGSTEPAASPYPRSVQRLIERFAALPGIGRRSAERLAFYVLKSAADEITPLAEAILEVKREVRHCSICANLTDDDPCAICADPQRDRSIILVVEQPKDLIALEQTGMHDGVYHVLMGCVSPLEGVGPEDLTVADLLARLDDPSRNSGGQRVREVVLGLNPTMEGDGTALHVAEEVRRRGVKVSRLARGLPSGSHLEYVSKAVLADAIKGRRPME